MATGGATNTLYYGQQIGMNLLVNLGCSSYLTTPCVLRAKSMEDQFFFQVIYIDVFCYKARFFVIHIILIVLTTIEYHHSPKFGLHDHQSRKKLRFHVKSILKVTLNNVRVVLHRGGENKRFLAI